MERKEIPNFIIDLVKIVGNVVRDSLDFNDYRITILIERKIGDKMGVVVESISVDKKMSVLEAETFSRRLKELIEKK